MCLLLYSEDVSEETFFFFNTKDVVEMVTLKVYLLLGLNEETGEKTVGFRLGSYATGTVGVGPVHFLKNIPERIKQAAQVFNS